MSFTPLHYFPSIITRHEVVLFVVLSVLDEEGAVVGSDIARGARPTLRSTVGIDIHHTVVAPHILTQLLGGIPIHLCSVFLTGTDTLTPQITTQFG